MERNRLDIHYCSKCNNHMMHYLEDTAWEENKKCTLHMLKCVICETPAISWVTLKENTDG